MPARAHEATAPPGPGRWFGRGSRGGMGQREEPVEGGRQGEARRGEAEESKSKPREVFESSGIPLLLRRLLWEASGACGESEVRRGLSGTKLRIHMICLAKRVKEK